MLTALSPSGLPSSTSSYESTVFPNILPTLSRSCGEKAQDTTGGLVSTTQASLIDHAPQYTRRVSAEDLAENNTIPGPLNRGLGYGAPSGIGVVTSLSQRPMGISIALVR